jgi:hypothetical protein
MQGLSGAPDRNRASPRDPISHPALSLLSNRLRRPGPLRSRAGSQRQPIASAGRLPQLKSGRTSAPHLSQHLRMKRGFEHGHRGANGQINNRDGGGKLGHVLFPKRFSENTIQEDRRSAAAANHQLTVAAHNGSRPAYSLSRHRCSKKVVYRPQRTVQRGFCFL